MKIRLALIVAVAVVLLGLSLWLEWSWSWHAWGGDQFLLQSCGIALVIWVLFADRGKPVRLLAFIAKGLVVSLVITSVLWFIVVGIGMGNVWLFFGPRFWFIVDLFEHNVLLPSLLPVAMSVTAYGVLRRLRAWLILLSSWYVAIYVVNMAYYLWLFAFLNPYFLEPPRVSVGSVIALDVLLVFLAFVVGCVFTGFYVGFRKQKRSPPP